MKDGPYKQKLEQVEALLEDELNYPLGEPHRTDEDVWTAFLLQLDKWELTDDLTKLDDLELFKKCNRSIGTTVHRHIIESDCTKPPPARKIRARRF